MASSVRGQGQRMTEDEISRHLVVACNEASYESLTRVSSTMSFEETGLLDTIRTIT
jgi:ABC-type tungstate transport system permease subunit